MSTQRHWWEDTAGGGANSSILLRPGSLALGLFGAASAAAASGFVYSLLRFDLEHATHPEGGGGASLAVLLILTFYGLCFGLPIAIMTQCIAPRSLIGAAVGLAIFSAIGGLVGSLPTPTLMELGPGASIGLAYALVALGLSAGIERLRRPAR